ncbi:MAG: YhdP family protein [Gallionella sp.]|nr:YhdP family protein [Gallionella sp.]
MLNSLPVRLLWHSLNWLTRITIVASAVTAVLCAVIVIALRYWLLPDIEQFHGKITDSFARAMGNPVSIGKIEGDWLGLHPHLRLTDVRILDKQQQSALVLPRIDAKVSWLSLLAAELRLSSLEIDRPELLIRRDEQGKMYVGSVALDTQGPGNDLSNWLLHQSRMVVRNATLVWVDEQRGAPPLVLSRVNLHFKNLFSRHQFALRAVPPADLATPLDVRGDFYGKSFDDLKKWDGELYTRLDHTDLLAWRPWLELPAQLSRGRGAVRGWLKVTDGEIAQLTADLALRDMATRLAEDVPEMDVHYLYGRVAWKTVPNGWEVDTRSLSLKLKNGVKLQPTDFYFRTVAAGKSQPPGGELRANLLQLESLVSLASFFPLEAKLRNQLNVYAPRGQVTNLEMQWQDAQEKLLGYNIPKFKIKGRFDNLALQQVGDMPGFSGLSVAVDGSETSGKLNINTHDLALNAPGMLREPLLFKTLTGQASWQRKQGELSVRADNVVIANEDLAGNLYGSFNSKAGTLGILDLTVNLTRGDIRRAARYTPLVALDKEDNDWLNDALLSGHTENLYLRIKGNLSDFPLDGSKDALFEMGAHAQDVSVEFAKDWPRIENISGDFMIRGNRLEVKSPSATILDARIHKLAITLPDMMSADMPLEIRGEAEAANNTFLQFIQKSPVRGYINGFTDGMSAGGDGHLDLYAHIPLLGDKPVKVLGKLRVQASDMDFGEGVPLLRNTRGELSFTESGMKTAGVTAEILGGAAYLSAESTEGGVVRASLHGRANLEALRKSETHPLLEFLRGGAAWDANISVVNKTAQVVLNSSLQGISSTLPAPFTKRANEIWPLHVEKKNLAEHQDMIVAQLGKLVNARLQRSEENGVSVIKRGVVSFGRQGKSDVSSIPAKDGIWLTGHLPAFSLQGWDSLIANSEQTAVPIAGANLHIDRLSGYGLDLNDLQISAAKRGDGLAAQLSSTLMNGELVWQPKGYAGGGKVVANLRNLHWPEKDKTKASSPTSTLRSGESVAAPHPRELPAMEIAIEDLLFKGKQIGRFELVGYPEGQDWRLRRLRITNPDGSVTGDGVWHGANTSMQTQVNLLLEISNAGKILARSGYPNTVKNGSGKLIATLRWDGQPDEFNYASLDGALKLDTGKGQFLKMDPGIGKLLGILSLQALPKRITLDFTDVFSAGFEFDNINGNATIKRGVMQTQDLHIDGSSAKVTMKGQVNLNDETQNLRVVVLPTLGSSVSMLSAFAAGPVVGLGALIVSKVLGNPLDKLMSFEYNVSGTWSDPNVVKVGEKPVKLRDVKEQP